MHHSFQTELRILKTLLDGYLKGLHIYCLKLMIQLIQKSTGPPLTLLSTTYKLLTSIITKRMYVFMETNDLLHIEQKGCWRGSYGCKDQLLINRMIIEDCKSKHRNISMAWIDYQKIFDSVPHIWIL